MYHIIQIYSGITSGRVLDGELLYTTILEVNLFAFAYRLFHEDFSFLFYFWVVLIFLVQITDKGVHPDLKPGRSRLSVLTSKVFMVFDRNSSKVIMSSGITHQR